MQRRPFLQKLSLISTAVLSIPLDSLSHTIQNEPKKLRFIVASDGHFGQPKTDYTRTHSLLMESINAEEQVDFVVFNGDLIHDDPALMPQVKLYFDTLKSPYYVTRGNHDRVSNQEWCASGEIPKIMPFKQKIDLGLFYSIAPMKKANTFVEM